VSERIEAGNAADASETELSALSSMTLDEKCLLVAGADLWHLPAIERLGIPALKVSDGPSGVRGERWTGRPSALFPCGSALGATWDPALVERVGAALGAEARDRGVHVVLAPTVNLQRTPIGGRNFECYSEDPHLSARLGVAFITGLQSTGVSACVKHYVANDTEFDRMTISSEPDERTLRELCLVPFEAAVTEAGAWSVMAAYNRVFGTYCSEHARLLDGVLRSEWGFDGLVMSDWYGTHSTVAAALAGLDLEMPGPPQWFGTSLAAAVRAGEVPETVVEEKARRVLALGARTGLFDAPTHEELSIDRPQHRALARDAAVGAIVLLKTDPTLLPLSSEPSRPLRTLAVIGPNADIPALQGGGSAAVTTHPVLTPLEAIRARAGPDVDVAFERGCVSHRQTLPLDSRRLAEREMRVDYFAGADFEGKPVLEETTARAWFVWLGPWDPAVPAVFSARVSGTFVADETGAWCLSLTSAGRSRLLVDGTVVVDNWEPTPGGSDSFFGLGSTEVKADVWLDAGREHAIVAEYANDSLPGLGGIAIGCEPPRPDDLLERAVALAARSDAVVLVAGTSAEWETEGRDRKRMELPGRQDELIARVAAANPRTVVVVNAGSPVAMRWADDVAAVAQLWFPGEEGAPALASVLFGDADPGGRLPLTIPRAIEDTPAFTSYPGEQGKVVYGESVFGGYRWYDRRRIEPRFAFGHGLSYTSFRLGALELDRSDLGPDGTVELRVPVTNTGTRAGTEVVQCYVHDVKASVARPEKELRAFAKVALAPGQSRSVIIGLDRRAFAFWDPETHDWLVEPGEFEICVGVSSRDIRAVATVTVSGAGATDVTSAARIGEADAHATMEARAGATDVTSAERIGEADAHATMEARAGATDATTIEKDAQ
jgi:beta-glucosidase